MTRFYTALFAIPALALCPVATDALKAQEPARGVAEKKRKLAPDTGTGGAGGTKKWAVSRVAARIVKGASMRFREKRVHVSSHKFFQRKKFRRGQPVIVFE